MNVTQDKNIDYASKKAFSLDVVRAAILTEQSSIYIVVSISSSSSSSRISLI